jgi:hypothetical protein
MSTASWLRPTRALELASADPAWRWPALLAVRICGAGLLLTMAGIHLHLYRNGFSTVPTIGRLFLLNAVLGAVVALAVLLTPRRWFLAAAAAGALLQIGTLGALILSLTVGLFGFTESLDAPLLRETIAVEAAGFLVLALPVLWRARRWRRA